MNVAGNRWAPLACLLCLGLLAVPAPAQTNPTPPTPNALDLGAQVQQLKAALQQTQAQLLESEAEIRQLRETVRQLAEKMAPGPPAPAAVPESIRQDPARDPRPSPQRLAASVGEQNRAQISRGDFRILQTEVQEQAQDKVESNLKSRVLLSGIVLFTSFANFGQVDNLDAPTIALPSAEAPSSGAFGASLRQSILGLTGIGPKLMGAATSADIAVDFFGGLPSGYAATASGLMRLRVARVRLDWPRTSLVAGLDAPFFSPNLPSTYMSLGVPALAAAGNLWAWTPTLRLDQRLPGALSPFEIQAGVMDPPGYATSPAPVRRPTPGESSRQPTYAVRISAQGGDESRPVALGASAIYSRQQFYGGASIAQWGGVADWRVPLMPHLEWTGQLFSGRGLDAFGGVPLPYPPAGAQYFAAAAPALARIPLRGGWMQLKLKLDSRNQLNFAAGYGGRNADALRAIAPLAPSLAALSPRSEMLLMNYIFQPWSDFVLSPEYRRLRTYWLTGSPAMADQVGLAAGFLF